MKKAGTAEIDGRIHNEIRTIIADAIKGGGVLQVGPHARRLAETYPGGSMSEGRIADEIILAASRSLIAAIEISRT